MTNLVTSEILNPLWGSLRLALFDRRGLSQMDASTKGVWFSFIAPLAMLPFMLWFPQMVDKDSAVRADADNIWWLRQVLGYLVALMGFPLLMFYVTRFLKIPGGYKLMVATMNWAAVWQTALVLGGYFFYLSDAVPFMLGNAALFVASGFTLVYLTYVMRVTLEVKTTMALGFISLMAVMQLISYLLTQA